jgi:hypothetical protein
MKTRCLNPNFKQFKDYGGRGIIIDPAWVMDFRVFLKAVGSRPSPAHTLDRKDNTKGYEPGNVQWALRKEQNRNKRSNRLVEHEGRLVPISQAAEESGITPGVLKQRLNRGMSAAEALVKTERPLRRNETMVTARGRTLPIALWAKETGISRRTIAERLRRGDSGEKAIEPLRQIKKPRSR